MNDTPQDLMEKRVITCHPQDTLLDAAELMRRHDVGALPVVDEDHRPVGMVTDRDIVLKAMEGEIPLSGYPVQDAMSAPAITVSTEDDLHEAERQMCTHRIRRVPVTDGAGRVAGTLSISDLARAATKDKGSRDLDRQEVAAILQAIVGDDVAAEATS